MTMTRDQIEAAARAIGGDGHGWKARAALKLSVSERTLRDAINAGRWSADFEAKLVAVMASDNVRVGAVQSADAGIKADLIEIAGGDSAGWQQRAADASGLSISTIKSALEGKASEKTKARIRETLIGAATAGGVRPLGRQVGEWVVAMPEGRAADKVGVIAEAVVFHMSEPMVVVHITHRMGVAGSPPKVDVMTRWIEQAADRGEAHKLMETAISKGEQFIKHQLDAIRAYKLRQEAITKAMTIGSVGDDEDLVERSAFRELLVSGNVEKDGDTHANVQRRADEDFKRLSAEIKEIKKKILAGEDVRQNLEHLENVSEQKGRAYMLRQFAKSVVSTGEYASPAAAVIADHLYTQELIDRRSPRGQHLVLESAHEAGLEGYSARRLIETRTWAMKQAIEDVALQLGGFVVGSTMIWINKDHAEHSDRFQQRAATFMGFYALQAAFVREELTQAQLRHVFIEIWNATAKPA